MPPASYHAPRTLAPPVYCESPSDHRKNRGSGPDSVCRGGRQFDPVSISLQNIRVALARASEPDTLCVITSFRGKVFSQEGHYFGYRIVGRVGVPLDVPSHAYGGGIHIVYVRPIDRKSTRLNSSHLGISYAVFCL